eukprot:171459-Chlamydomonas_euryale.AAC.1
MLLPRAARTAGLIERVLQAEGYSRSDLLRVVDQLSPFESLTDSLKACLVDAFATYDYPAGARLVRAGQGVSEAHVVLSGCVVVADASAREGGEAAAPPPRRVQPGSVLGLELMISGLPSQADATVDPNFVTRIATLSHERYQAAIQRWAAEQVWRVGRARRVGRVRNVRQQDSEGGAGKCRCGLQWLPRALQ